MVKGNYLNVNPHTKSTNMFFKGKENEKKKGVVPLFLENR